MTFLNHVDRHHVFIRLVLYYIQLLKLDFEDSFFYAITKYGMQHPLLLFLYDELFVKMRSVSSH